jgi:hypothetical protein
MWGSVKLILLLSVFITCKYIFAGQVTMGRQLTSHPNNSPFNIYLLSLCAILLYKSCISFKDL